MKEITEFAGQYRWASNFHMCWIQVGDMLVPSVEHGFVAYKTTDPAVRDKILGIATPAEAKKFGRGIELRPGWDQMRKRVMLKLELAKYVQHPDLAALLVATEDAYLEEGNTWHDNFWGACRCDRHAGDGLNYLGRILMAVRDVIRID